MKPRLPTMTLICQDCKKETAFISITEIPDEIWVTCWECFNKP